MKLVAVTTSTFAECETKPLTLLKRSRFRVRLNPYRRKLRDDEILEICKGAQGIIAGTETLDRNTLSHLPGLKVISRCGSGLDNVDVGAAKNLGIKVFSTPDAVTVAVAELTLALILNLLRKVNQMDGWMRKGKWEKQMGNLLTGKTVGIIGFGRIGRKVAELLKPFNCKIMFSDPRYSHLGQTNNRRCVSLRKLLKESDVITVHASSEKAILTGEEFALMKRGAWLINTSRGTTISEPALAKSLKEGKLRGAALDVFKEEPYHGELTKFENVVLTCHIGSYAKEARAQMELKAVENLLFGL